MCNSLRTRLFSPRFASGLLLALVYVAPQQAAQSPAPAAQACTVSGIVQSGAVVLPGVSVTALGSDGTEIAATSTEQNGSYVLKLTGPGAYNIRVSLAAFAGTTREITLTAAECRGRLDVSLTLASRAAAPASSPIASGGSAPNAVVGATPATSSNPTSAVRGTGAGRGVQAGATAAARDAAGSSSSTSSPTPPARRRRRRWMTRRQISGRNCSFHRGSRPTRRPRPLRRRGFKVNRTMRSSLAGEAGGVSSAKAAPKAVAERVDLASRPALAVVADGADLALADLDSAPGDLAACAVVAVSRAARTTPSAVRCSTPSRIRSTAASASSRTTYSSATAHRSAVR